MAKRTRDYRAGYQRRLALARERGLSVSQARGHARASRGEAPVSVLKRNLVIPSQRSATVERIYQAVRGLADGKTLAQAAREAGTTARTVQRFNEGRDFLVEGEGGYRLQAAGSALLLSAEAPFVRKLDLDARNLRLMAAYDNAVARARHSGDESLLARFEGKYVTDIEGRRYPLVTSLDDIEAIYADADAEALLKQERFIESEKRAYRRADYAR
jgi:hypothetical protein